MRSLLGLLMFLQACGSSPEAPVMPPADQPPTSLNFLSTDQLAGTPEYRSLVDRAAAYPMVGSPAVGIEGTPAPEYAAFDEVWQAASPEQRLELLRHTSPVLRVHAARNLVYAPGDVPSEVRALLGDRTPVTLSGAEGCEVGPDVHTTVGAAVRSFLDIDSGAQRL